MDSTALLEEESSLPWADWQYLRINGKPYCYTTKRRPKKTGLGPLILVHLPGGRTRDLDEIRADGHDVVMPRFLRSWS